VEDLISYTIGIIPCYICDRWTIVKQAEVKHG
jgi:hypothetical protein